MNTERVAQDALDDLKRSLEKIDKTYVSHYLKNELRKLVKEIEKEIDLSDNSVD